jgi:TPR repeat protein
MKIEGYRQGAVKGHIHQYKLGMYYFNDDSVPQNKQEAVRWFRKAAKQNFSAAEYQLGMCYFNGIGVPRNEVMAVRWFRRAADQDYPKAQASLGACYMNGSGIGKDDKEAVSWFRKAALKNNPEALYNLGVCYVYGDGVDKDESKGLDYYHQAAKRGFAGAQYVLGDRYARGDGVGKDEKETVKWYHAAALQEHGEARYYLGICYRIGFGVVKNRDEAIKWNQKSADQGNPLAQYKLGVSYTKGSYFYKDDKEPFFYKKDDKEAARWYTRAAEQNHPGAAYNLGVCYSHGKGVIQDDQKALKYYQKAAELGHLKAQYCLGVRYFRGKTVVKNMKLAKEWFEKAANQGHLKSKFYLNGQKKISEDLTITWWKAALSAANGNATLLKKLLVSTKENLVVVNWDYAPQEGVYKGVTLSLLAVELSQQKQPTLLEFFTHLPRKIHHNMDWNACAVDEKNDYRGITLAWWVIFWASNEENLEIYKKLLAFPQSIFDQLNWNAAPQSKQHKYWNMSVAMLAAELYAGLSSSEDDRLLKRLLSSPSSVRKNLDWHLVTRGKNYRTLALWSVDLTPCFPELLDSLLDSKKGLESIDWNSSLQQPDDDGYDISFAWYAVNLAASGKDDRLLSVLLRCPRQTFSELLWNATCSDKEIFNRAGQSIAWMAADLALYGRFDLLNKLLDAFDTLVTPIDWNCCGADSNCPHSSEESIADMAKELAEKGHYGLLQKLLNSPLSVLKSIKWNNNNLFANILSLFPRYFDPLWIKKLLHPELIIGCDLYIVEKFDAEKCKIKGNGVILTDDYSAYFVLKDQVVMRDSKPLAVQVENDHDVPDSEDKNTIPQKVVMPSLNKIAVINEATTEADLNFPLLVWDDSLKAEFTKLFYKKLPAYHRALTELPEQCLRILYENFFTEKSSQKGAFYDYLRFLIAVKSGDQQTVALFRQCLPSKFGTYLTVILEKFCELSQPQQETPLSEAKHSLFFSAKKPDDHKTGKTPTPS